MLDISQRLANDRHKLLGGVTVRRPCHVGTVGLSEVILHH